MAFGIWSDTWGGGEASAGAINTYITPWSTATFDDVASRATAWIDWRLCAHYTSGQTCEDHNCLCDLTNSAAS